MLLYKANGERWNPHFEETMVLDDLLRGIVDAIRYRRRTFGNDDPYGAAVVRLSEAATNYTAVRRANPTAAGPVPHFELRAG